MNGESGRAGADCVRAIKKIRVDRELADVQRELDRLQEQGQAAEAGRMDTVLKKKQALLARRESLIEVESGSRR